MADDKPDIEMSEQTLCARFSDITDGPSAWALIQSSGFIGFGVVSKTGVRMPPGVDLDWARVTDLRLFGEKGEWHVWQTWNQTHRGRFYRKGSQEELEEFHYLWGTKEEGNGWMAFVEDRGAVIRLPISTKDLPLRLRVAQVVGRDPGSGLAGVVDAALIALVPASTKIPFLPPSS